MSDGYAVICDLSFIPTPPESLRDGWADTPVESMRNGASKESRTASGHSREAPTSITPIPLKPITHSVVEVDSLRVRQSQGVSESKNEVQLI